MEAREKFTVPKEQEEYICCNGSFQYIIDNIVNSGLLSRELAVESLNYLMENPGLLEKGQEVISAKPADDSVHIGESGFIVDGANFYVQLRKSTILIAVMLVSKAALDVYGLDSTALIPFIAEVTVSNLDQFVFRLYEESGEKCIIHELASRRPSVVLPKDIKKKMGKNCTKNYNCNFRKKGKCNCEISDIVNICEILKDKGAVVKSGNCYGYIV